LEPEVYLYNDDLSDFYVNDMRVRALQRA
jgi:hypothetical protein